MSELTDDAARRAWQGQRSAIDSAGIARTVERRISERRRQTRVFLACAAIIVPGWVAAFVVFPDLRPLSAIGLIVAAVLGWHATRRQHTPSAVVSCAAFQLAVLRRERDFHRSMSTWGLVALLAGQVAIVATLLMIERFEKNAFFAGSLTVFIVTVIAILARAFTRFRKTLSELEQELSALSKRVEA